LVYQMQLKNSSSSLINTHLNAGIYLIRVRDKNQVIHQNKLIISK